MKSLACCIPLLALAACGGGEASTAPSVPAVASVAVTPATASVLVGQTLQLTTTITDAAGNVLTGRVVTWASSNTAVATVNSTGLVTGVAQGQATITSTSEGQSGTATITGTTALVYTDPAAFQQATASLGAPTVVNFDDINASPGNTIAGRTPFDGSYYASKGFTFASPGGYALYIAPGGLFWNASNSLSIGHFPFDTTSLAPTNDADSLMVTLNPGCTAVSFQLVDNGTRSANEFVEFFEASGNSVLRTPLPADYTNYRAFVGLVSTTQVVAKILVAENANDGDDVDYDDFTCFK